MPYRGDTASDLSGDFWNPIVHEEVLSYDELVGQLVKDLMAAGYPPFNVPLSPRDQYERLEALRRANSTLFTNDAEAQAKWEQLRQRFGGSPLPVAEGQQGYA